MKKIVTVVGARPQFVKAAALSRELRKPGRFREILVHTGQHFDENMSGIFFEEMEIPRPDYHLEVNSLSHGAMTGRMLEKLEPVLLKEQPDFVLVYGDTNSTLAAALTASKMHIRLIHVEAGLRSFNMRMPEEVNRIVTDRLSQYLFCPSETAVKNLEVEGFGKFPCHVVFSGDVMYDAAVFYAGLSAQRSRVSAGLPAGDFILSTLHRSENTDDPVRLKSILHALNRLNKIRPVILPMHPRTQKAIRKMGLTFEGRMLDPVGYFDMLELLKRSQLVMTDSGGLQKEAFFFKKHCVTLRDDTEWTELVKLGYNVLAGADEEKIVDVAGEMLRKKSDFNIELFGNGRAGEAITAYLLDNSH